MSESEHQNHLWVGALATVAPILALVVMVSAWALDASRAEMELRYRSLAAGLAAAVDVELESQMDALMVMSAAARDGHFNWFRKQAEDVVAGSDRWSAIDFLTPGGDARFLSTLPARETDELDPSSEEAVIARRVRDRRLPSFGSLFAAGTGEAHFQVFAPIVEGGTVVSVISAVAKGSKISGLIAAQGAERGFVLAVFDGEGRMVASSTGAPVPGRTAAAKPQGNGLYRTAEPGADAFVHALVTSEETGWTVSVGQTEAAYFAAIASRLAPLALGGLGAALLSALAAVVFGRRFGRSLSAEERRGREETELARLEAVRAGEAAAEAAAEADRCSQSRSRFLAAASHDLRQPMQALRLLVEVLRLQPLDGRMGTVVSTMDEALSGAEGMLRSLLDVSKLDAGTVAPVASDVCLSEILDSLRAECETVAREKGIEFRMRRCGCVVRTDKDMLRQILANLVANATKFTERGGVLVGCRRRGANVLVEVWDTGLGIPDDKIDLVWEEFYQIGNDARDKRCGIGLGLSIVQRTARLLGHRVELRSRYGRGTVFAVEVPLVPAAAARPGASAAA